MKTYVCWVCMNDFDHNASLVKHEVGMAHLELMLKQAMGQDDDEAGQRRSDKRNFLYGMGDMTDITMKDDQYQKVSERSTLTFCRCILGWKVGLCSKCSVLPPDKNVLHKQIFDTVVESQEVCMGIEDRRKALGKGLMKLLDESDYDSMKKNNIKKADERLGPRLLLKYITHHINKKIRMPDPELRKRSPLVTSKIREQSMAKVHVLGKSVTNPTVFIATHTERINKMKRCLIFKQAISAQSSSAEISPLLPSHERKAIVSLSDNVETFWDRAVTNIRPMITKLGPVARKPLVMLPIEFGGRRSEKTEPLKPLPPPLILSNQVENQ